MAVANEVAVIHTDARDRHQYLPRLALARTSDKLRPISVARMLMLRRGSSIGSTMATSPS